MRSFLAGKRPLIVAVLVFLCIAIYSFSCIIELSTPLKSWLAAFYSDKQLVLWAGVIANLSVVVIALFLNTFVDYIRRPRFQVDCGNEAPWQIRKEVLNKSDTSQVHIRLRIMNIGRSSEDACEVRVEEIYRIPAEQGFRPQILVDHDPRALKWVGRSAKAIALNAGAFDFADLGVRRADAQHRVYLDFAERGHVNLDRDKRVTSAFRICGTVYGRRAIPKRFTFELTWDPDSDFGPVEISG